MLLAASLIFTAAPSFRNEHTSHWQEYEAKYQNPFTPSTGVNPSSHAAKLELRLTVPVLAWMLGFGRDGTYLLSALAALLVCLLTPTLMLKACHDNRRLASVLSMFVAGSHLFTIYFRPLSGYFDATAITLALGAFLIRSPTIQCGLIFLALFSDERAVFPCALAPLFHLSASRHDSRPPWRQWLAAFTPLVVALAVWLAAREILRVQLGMATPLAGIGQSYLRANYNLIPLAIWETLQAGWIAVFLGLALLARRRPLVALAATGVIVAGVISSMLVADLTRSMSYVIPVIFVAGAGFAPGEYGNDRYKKLLGALALAAIVQPNIQIIANLDSHYLVWSKPLPVTLPIDLLKAFFGR